jgi:hypothetical protein
MKKISAYSKKENQEEKKEKVYGIQKCEIHGCNWEGHIQADGHWNCRYHFGRKPESWPHITMVMHNHEYLFNWYEKVNAAPSMFFEQVQMGNSAPNRLHIYPNEKHVDYKKRLFVKIHQLLKHGSTS